jgi:hypothetical protein
MTIEEIYSLKYRIKDGYCYCRYKGKRIQRSHIVAIEILGWVWDSNKEHVHHKDFNSVNDMPDNLQLMEKGKHLSLHKKGIRHHMFGKHHTKESREKMSLVHSGEKHHFYGVPCSEERKRKSSETQKGRKIPEEQKKKISEALKKIEHKKGYKLTEQTKLKMSLAKKGKRFIGGHYV